MAGLSAPRPVIQRPEGLSVGQIQAIIACKGRPRDEALIRVAADTGARLAEAGQHAMGQARSRADAEGLGRAQGRP
jgi:integrase